MLPLVGIPGELGEKTKQLLEKNKQSKNKSQTGPVQNGNIATKSNTKSTPTSKSTSKSVTRSPSYTTSTPSESEQGDNTDISDNIKNVYVRSKQGDNTDTFDNTENGFNRAIKTADYKIADTTEPTQNKDTDLSQDTQGRKSEYKDTDIKNIDFSDAFYEWLDQTGMNENYSGAADFMLNGTEEDWKNYLQDDVMGKFYQDEVYNNGVFDDDMFGDYWTSSKNKTLSSALPNVTDLTGGNTGFLDIVGNDAEIINDVQGYLYDNIDGYRWVPNDVNNSNASQILAEHGYEPNDQGYYDDIDKETQIALINLDLMAAAMAESLADDSSGKSWRQRFGSEQSLPDFNKLISLNSQEIVAPGLDANNSLYDDWGVNLNLDALENSGNPINYAPYFYDDENFVPVSNIMDLAGLAFGSGYGYKERGE